MEYLTVNLSGTVQRRTLGGRGYLVAPVTMVTLPGVLNGSKGPLLYRKELFGSNPEVWNHAPIIVNHPSDGKSARRPDLLDKFAIGAIYNTSANGKLVAEAWFDIEATRRVDNRILTALEQGQKLEASTGLFTKDVDAPSGATLNGKPYTKTIEAFVPDHLAILTDNIVGACSVRDGCGVNNKNNNSNQENQTVANTNQKPSKEELVKYITSNCDCWKDDAKTLNTMSDDRLLQLKENIEGSKKKDEEAEKKLKEKDAAMNKATQPIKVGDVEMVYNAEKGEWGQKQSKEGKPTKNGGSKNTDADNGEPATNREIKLEDLPVDLREFAAYGQQAMNRDKQELIDRLTCNLEGDEKKEAAAEYKEMPIANLEKLARRYAKPQPEQQQQTQNFLGRGFGNVANRSTAQKPKPLGLPTYNFQSPFNNSGSQKQPA